MKTLIVLLMTVVLSVSMLVACGGNAGNTDTENKGNQGTNTNTESENKNDKVENDSFVFKFKNTDVQINAQMAPIYEKLGKEDAYFESNSCAFQGLDKVYTYGSVIIQTYPVDEVDYVFSIELKDDTVETPEGIYIGASKADVENAYGTPADSTDSAYIYKKGQSQLNIMFDNDVVSAIVYISVED